MTTTELYKCLSDEQRVRILNLLSAGPLCVCYLQEILDEEQVKISKQLSYLKRSGLVEATRDAMWMVYSLLDPVSPLLEANLRCLRDGGMLPVLGDDMGKRKAVLDRVRRECCSRPTAVIGNHS